MSNKYRLAILLILTALLAGGNAQAVVVKGSVFGGGNQADVQINTTVNISAGQVQGNVYGGGNLGDVGKIVKNTTDYNYKWTNDNNPSENYTYNNTGVCTVSITGGTIGLNGENEVNDEDHGNVFGAGKGIANTYWCEKGMVYKTIVNITNGTVKGTVFGGGEIGRVENNATVTIGTSGDSETGNRPNINGNVFGAGKGLETHGYSALLRGNTTVTVQGKALVEGSVYGGGEISSVGRFVVAGGLPTEPKSGGTCTVTIKDNAYIGSGNTGDVFGSCKGVEPAFNSSATGANRAKCMQTIANCPTGNEGDTWDYYDEEHKYVWKYLSTETDYLDFLKTLALASHTNVTIDGNATVNNDVYGGGQRGITLGHVDVNIAGGTINNDVYGGGALANTNTENWKNNALVSSYHEVNGLTTGTSDVTGLYTRSGSEGSYTYDITSDATAEQGVTYYRLTDTRVKLTGGLVNGDVYGGGLGYNDQDDTKDIAAIVYGNVTVTLNGTKMKTGYSTGDNHELNAGRVFGANNVLGTPKGHVKVLVQNTASINNQDIDVVAVFGGGNQANYEPFNTNDYAEVHIEKGNVNENLIIGTVYGGGNQAGITGGTSVNMISGNVVEGVYGGCNTSGTVTGNTTVMLTGGTVGSGSINSTTGVITYTSKANVHGGGYGHMTYVNGDVDVQIGEMAQTTAGAVIWGDVYGGSAEGHVNAEKPTPGTIPTTFNTSATTTVSLYNGTINGDAYGGGLGTSDHPAMVGGDVFVKLNGDGTNTRTGKKGAIVNRIFGANNLYGTPKGAVTVNVYATQNRYKETVNDKFVLEDIDITNISNTATLKAILSDKITIAEALNISDISEQQSVLNNGSATADEIKAAITAVSAKIAAKDTDSDLATIKSIRYDVQAVYGGGNLSEYYPTNADSNDDDEKTAARTNVMIEGCNLTSINQVYGGGNAASVAGAHVKVDGTYEINEVFGGGNGNDPYQLNGLWYQNPGANIGFHNYTEITGTHTGTTINDAIVQTDKSDASTPDDRAAYGYGSGQAETEIYGGLIHAVYGGSNQRGNIRTTAISIYDDMDDDCPVVVDETYGGGKNAPMDGTIQLDLDCVKNMPMIFGGAKNADIYNDIRLDITNGKFDKVFGGNNMGGAIYGSITVNIEEKGCQPIIIDELYGGGYLAPYSKFGYEKDNEGHYVYENGKLKPLTSGQDPKKDPRINVISASKIGTIYGGGYQATVVGSPHINVNMEQGKVLNVASNYASGQDYTVHEIEEITDPQDANIILSYNAILEIGKIGTIYGGGNEADVIGDTYVEIGTGTWHNGTNGELVAISPARNAATITGDVFGGGHGLTSDVNSAMVTGTTNIYIANGTIAKSVYGGGELAQVDGDTKITVSGGTIGTTGQGGATWGNIYGGGKGQATSASDVLFGLIKGNTDVTVSGGTILHNVYGGGAYGSVGEFNYDNTSMPTSLKSNTNGGKATITITGGTIGSTGVENGMVFGSSRGDVDDGTIHDKLAWVYDAEVVIGTSGQGAVLNTPLIKGSVYGSGENGHTFHNTEVYIHSGTIGVDDDETVTYSNANPVYTGMDYNYTYHGNVYGGGCGTDTYSDANGKHYNPLAGIVYGETKVEITGGKITNNVYGAGAMGSVGKANKGLVHNTNKNELVVGDNNYGAFYDFGLSWPVAFTYEESEESTSEDKKYTGKTTVTVTGGQIGTTHSDAKGGNIYGAARGEAGDRYEMAEFANVRTSEVIIGEDGENGPQVKGSVFGGSANGHVYEDAIVRMYSGSVAKNLFGGGNGDGQYQTTLWDPTKSAGTLKDDPEDVHSWTAGKVYGNTYVYMYNGNVGQNVYGGGNLGSVGKGNYSGGKDDYSQAGYGELPEDDNANLWTGESSTDAYLFMNSGKAYVEIQAGTIGTENGLDENHFPTGNVFGSSRGKAAFDVGQLSPRYKYVPDFFLGYVNETEVVIGNSTPDQPQPRIYGSVYGGGQDGHVRRNTKVQVKNGIIGQEYSSGDLSSNQWMARGNVYGAGSGLGLYDTGQKDDQDNPIMAYNYSSGSVTCKTQVDIERGKIYQNVYGGGALSSVGPPFTGVQSGDETKTNDPEGTKKSYSYTQVNIKGGEIGQPTHNPSYGGNVYGASRGNASLNLDKSKFANVIWSELNVQGAATIKGSAFGGGEAGVVKHATEVNIGTTTAFTGTIGEDVYGGGEGALAIVGGNVTVNMGSGTVTGGIYGGGALANANTNTHETEEKTVGGQTRTVNTTGAQNTAAETAGMTTQVTMTGGSAKTVYGGGKEANVEGGTIVNIEGGTLSGTTTGTAPNTITSAVFGGGYGETTKVYGSVEVNIGTRTEDTTGETPTVTYGGTASITGDVYGGSAKGKVNTTDGSSVTTDDATTTVNLYGVTSFNGDLYGGGLGDNTQNSQVAANVYGPVTVTTYGGKANNVFGCNNLYGAPQGTVTVNINGTDTPVSPDTYAIGNVYGGGNIAAYGGSPVVNMAGGYANRIFGGGKLANVAGNVTVTVTGGHVIDDLYGGGELAHTNTGNWDFTNSTWLADKIDQSGATTYKTTVNLNGGILGDAFGGALGAANSPAYVYGDVIVTVNGAALPPVYTTETVEQVTYITLTSGRVFGGNNIAGTPKGNVKVHVLSTGSAYGIDKQTTPTRTFMERAQVYQPNSNTKLYDIGAVFGGGNEADYVPTDNQAPIVIIEGCDETVIESVYGGGNAAAVPETNVSIESAYFLEYVFGGGCGSGPNNKGANVGYLSYPTYPYNGVKTAYGTGNTDVDIKGGYIDNSFSGSDTRGDVAGNTNVVISGSNNNVCALVIGSAYGGGRKTDLNHDVNFEVRCQPNEIKNIFGGSEEANINGNVTLTLMGGKYESVFGGNKNAGTITGDIIVNIQETDEGCAPIEIDNLYGGSFYAPYNGHITVNLISFTSIGTVYGGSFGEQATVTGDTKININQIKGSWAGHTYGARTIPDEIGHIRTVYGGGRLGKVIGNTEINIGTATTVQLPKLEQVGNTNEYRRVLDDQGHEVMETHNILGAKITGDIYGGGMLADVTGNTYVNIGAIETEILGENDEPTGEYEYIAVDLKKSAGNAYEGVTIGGNVYGGGQGAADNFECDKAMVGTEGNYGANNTGSTYVHIGNGTIGNGTTGGNVYGGGMVGRVEANTNVTVGLGDGIAPGVASGETTVSAPVINGNVFGAGQGVATHGYSGLARGNSTVTIKGNTQVLGSVYGGGQKATVGRFWVKGINDNNPNAPEDTHNRPTGMPYAPMAGGYCTVIIGGYAQIGPDDMMMTATGGPADAGHVFGACKGIIAYQDTDTEPLEENVDPTGKGPGRWYAPNGEYTWQSYSNDEAAYLEFIETLALTSNTEVTITGHAFIKGSVYGGSENGRVLDSTYVKIQEYCQIGAGFDKATNKSLAKYNEADFIDPTTATADDIIAKAAILQECNSWPYQAPYAPYDPYADEYDAKGGSSTGSDGHTFYGNVFGGGSGYYPYKPGLWHWKAGSVDGNTRVEISGGHILTNIYGGNELTNVGKGTTDTESGTSTIIMTNGTLGVPRTLAQIEAHPVTCYLFGAGKGDQRALFNKQTNVNDVKITITGGIIYGSVFGGGEDGHVQHDVKMKIGDKTNHTGPSIGTWGTSYVDGNVFGGGRGFAGDTYTAGNVAGSIYLDIHGGTMLGSVYGGGRLGSVGYGLFDVSEEYTEHEDGHIHYQYGAMQPDDEFDDGEEANINTGGGFKRGYITVNITGGTIGNDYEYQMVPKDISDWTTWRATNYVPFTEYESFEDDGNTGYRLAHTKGGNVFAGGMGRRTLLNGNPIPANVIDWLKLGNAKSTKLTISGNAIIKSNVYGGGEMGSVLGYHQVLDDDDNPIKDADNNNIYVGTEIIIKSGTIGTKITDTDFDDKYDDTYYYGSVYGGGKGIMDGGGNVSTNTYVEIRDGLINQNIYGGGQLGSVGTIEAIDDDDIHDEWEDPSKEGANRNLYYTYYNFGLSWPIKIEYVDYDYTDSYTAKSGNTYIKIKGGRIGTTGSDNGDIFGGSKGTVTGDRYQEALIGNVYDTHIDIDYSGVSNVAIPDNYIIEKITEEAEQKPKLRLPVTYKGIAGSVYGGAEDGHVYHNTYLTLQSGLVGHGIYGGGKGKGTYTGTLKNYKKYNPNKPTEHTNKTYTEDIYSLNAGRVYGETNVKMVSGYVMRSIFGGGNLGSVGIGNYSGGADDYSKVGYGEMPENGTTAKLWDDSSPSSLAYKFMHSGKTNVEIIGGTIGYLPPKSFKTTYGLSDKELRKLSMKDDLPTGNIFGGSRGIAAPNGYVSPRTEYFPEFFLGYTNATDVKIGNGTGNGPTIFGSVYGGGQDGHVRRDTKVTINNGTIGVDYDDIDDLFSNITDITDITLWARGNVYGAGSGIGQFEVTNPDNGKKVDKDGNDIDPNDTNTKPAKEYNYSSGSVTGTTTVVINEAVANKTIIYQNVYGGGALASIGPPNIGAGDEIKVPVTGHLSRSYTSVTINGGVIGTASGYEHSYGGNVYGASRGLDLAMDATKFATDIWSDVTINQPDGKTTTIYGNIFGGGEIGFVRGGVNVNIIGGEIKQDVYGGGALANTNTGNWDLTNGDFYTSMLTLKATATGQRNFTKYDTKVNLLGGIVGGDVYGGGLGRLPVAAKEAIGTSGEPGYVPAVEEVTAVEAMVYGDVIVNLNGVENADYDANNPIFSSLRNIDVNDSNSDYILESGTSESPITGAIVNRIFGANNLNGTPKGHIKVHVFATQNRDKTTGITSAYKYPKHPIKGDKEHPNESLANYLTRLVSNGNYYGISIVTTAVTAAQDANNAYIAASTAYNAASEEDKAAAKATMDEANTALDQKLSELDNVLATLYDVQAVYGGGNLAEYVYGKYTDINNIIDQDNSDLVEAARTEVIIDGCGYTSIRQVYGGGNAASTSGSFVEVNGTYEIDEVFGGGNGADPYEVDGVWYENPGANVGYHNYTHVIKYGETGNESGTLGYGSKAAPYKAIDNTDADTPTNRRAHYAYGSGVATTNIRGGTIHYVFGGSNKKGNISTAALSVYEDADDDCPIDIHETYGGGKDAPMDGKIDLKLDCVKNTDIIYGGAKNADINNDVTLNITNGTYKKVFGGNNTSGAINGSITVNIEETGCVPIDIVELYGGGYLAPYSIYGYEKENGSYKTESVEYIDDNNQIQHLDQRIPLKQGETGALTTPHNDPRINIISATHIGVVYGGGYQAKVVGSPYVNVNMTNGRVEVKNTAESGDPVYKDGNNTVYNITTPQVIDGKNYATLQIGTIDTIYGGGNLADIVGDTHVEIGTGRWVTSWDANGNPIYETVESGTSNKYYYKVQNAAETYSSDECATNNANLPGAIKTTTELTAEQALRLNELLSKPENELYSVGGHPSEDDAEAYNATLDGYITTADVKTPAKWAWYDENDDILTNQPTPARNAANITGDVFGGGKGLTDNFKCDKAMVGAENEAANDPTKRNGGTNVIIANGTVGGSVYGGGMIARVEKNSAVTIGFESGIGEPIIENNVFGAGMGANTHGYAGLVRGNSSVIIQGKSKVKGSVYGGGMQASIGRYFLDSNGLPIDLKSGGKATVIVRGDAEIGPDNMVMKNTETNKPDNTGHVFGAGKGVLPYHDFDGNPLVGDPWRATPNNTKEYYNLAQQGQDYEDKYINFINTLGITNRTEVTIGGNAFIKGSVYGGSESGYVLKNTHVTIQDNCQIGNGYVQMYDDGENDGKYLPTTSMTGVNRRYTTAEWAAGHLYVENDPDVNLNDAKESALKTKVGNNYSNSLPECASWPYEAPYAPYDKFAETDGTYEDAEEPDARGGRPTGSDGHTFYGNVFGGGSGYNPYAAGKWHFRAGSVGGNTVVDITGGHILTSVYGGNEMTNVAGSATVNMTGGTLGVPRTLGQIATHPVTCYLFGAGKGDMRTFFNTETNVASAQVNVTGNARIYGSVFGGGEDGHVLGNVEVNIGDVTIGNTNYTENGLIIGTTGTSYVDGNVFGAGRGFNGEAITAGSVGGNIEVNIKGGTMLGSIYGGGRLASVGIGFNAVTDAKYGQFTEDADGKTYGHITVNISGGTIGNDIENQFFAVEVEKSGKTAQQVETSRKEGLQALKINKKIPNTDFELYDSLLVGESTTKYKYLYRTIHTKGGNVYGGSMGRLTLLDNSFNPIWPQLGQAKSATVNITGGTIKSNVYGGGEMGSVRDNTYVTIGGTRNANGTVTPSGSPTIYRDVYGGGYGSSINSEDSKAVVTSANGNEITEYGYSPLQWAGIVGIGTELNIYGGWIKKSVYGGGEMASVGIINYVLDKTTEYDTEGDVPDDKLIFRKNPTNNKYTVYANIVKHADETNSFALSWPYKFEYVEVPNGPSYLGTTKVNIKGGRIGITGKDFMGPFAANGVTAISPIDGHTLTDAEKKDARMDNGDVFGGGKGLAGDRYEMAFLANVGSTEVTIDYQKKATKEATPTNYKDKTESGTYANDCITGSVYAGAENGHVMGNTQLTLKNGLVGHAIYGGGKGKGTYTQSITRLDGQGDKTISIYSITAGKVYGNTKVDMNGGIVVRNVYGGGNMGSVGKGNYAGGYDDYSYIVVNDLTYNGYGEAIQDNLWVSSQSFDPDEPIGANNEPETYADYFLSSGKTEVNITGGTIGYIKATDAEDSMKDGLPYGNVFGGCRGESAPNIKESPRYHYSPQFYSGYTNETHVTIGDPSKVDDENYTGPKILGSVYGGGQDGHVRRDANVTIYSGEIGKAYGPQVLKDKDEIYITDLNNPVWLHRGNVYGAGSGIGKYQYDFNYNGKTSTDANNNGTIEDNEIETGTYNNKPIKEEDYSTSAGSVTRFTKVEINGGTIHHNVYGGGSLASVGAPKIPPTRTDDNPYYKDDNATGHGPGKQSLNEVIINGGTIGDVNSRTVEYGGNVYGASRGLTELGSQFATSVWTKVEANTGYIYGNVFGGGEAGSVTMDTKVIIGGTPTTGSGAPRRAAPAEQSNAAAPAGNVNSGTGNTGTSTPANVATEAPVNRSITTRQAQ